MTRTIPPLFGSFHPTSTAGTLRRGGGLFGGVAKGVKCI